MTVSPRVGSLYDRLFFYLMGGGSLTFGGPGGTKTSWRKSKFGEDVCCTQGHHILDLRLARPKKRFFWGGTP